MRDTVRLRRTLMFLACVPALACNPAPRPDQSADGNKNDEETRKRRADAAARRRGERGRTGDERRGDPRRGDPRRGGADSGDASPDARRAAAARRRAEVAEGGEGPRAVSPERQEYYARQAAETGDAAVNDAAAAGTARAPAEPAGAERPPGIEPEAPTDPGHASAGPLYPGDPPFIDGYNPEEATCTSGNWCGSNKAAQSLGVGDAAADILGCPPRIAGARRDRKPMEGAEYEGLSQAPTMQGALNQHGTELARAKAADPSTAETCCYHWFEYCSGRPLLDASGPVVAAIAPGRSDWQSRSDAARISAAGDPELCARLAEAWRADAQAEHASIASFARSTLELLAVGAPPDLVAGTQRAALDEVDHARRCFAIASAYDTADCGPGPLPLLAPRVHSLAELAADTFAEGGVAETIAALCAERAAAGCTDAVVAEHLRVMAADEARHAGLAWSTLRWAVQTGGERVRAAIVARMQEIRPPHALPPAAESNAEALARHGRLDARAHAIAVRDAWRDIIDPMLAAL